MSLTPTAVNPWLPPVVSPEADPAGPGGAPIPASAPRGPIAPQASSVTAPEWADQLHTVEASPATRLWVVGAHGGAAESTVATLLAAELGAAASEHRWPVGLIDSAPPAVLLTARTHLPGLQRAQVAMRAWASGSTPPIRLVGLVVINDAPGRLPRPVREQLQVLGGGVPRLWSLPWNETHRLGDLATTTRPVDQFIGQVAAAVRDLT